MSYTHPRTFSSNSVVVASDCNLLCVPCSLFELLATDAISNFVEVTDAVALAEQTIGMINMSIDRTVWG